MLNKILKCSVFLLLLMLFSCAQDNSVLSTMVEDYSLESVEDGTVLEPGASVNIVLTELGNRADLVKIILEDADALEIASTEVEPEMLKGLGMPMDLPSDIETGVYYLRFDVMDGDIQLYQDQRYFFIAEGLYNISSLETYPPGIKAGDRISARIVLDSPDESDPWLRWSLAEEVLQEGFLSEIGTGCNFSVPELGGVYSLRVELFPVSPLKEQVSSVYRNSDLFVTTGEGDELPWKIIEDRTYLYFIEFGDALNNKMNPEDVPRIFGDPGPSSQDHYSGIFLDEKDGLLFEDYALPLYADGSSEDFLMAIAFSYTEMPETGVYNIFRTGNDYSFFSVNYQAETREFLAEFKSFTQSFQSSLPLDLIQSQEAVFLELSFESLSDVAVLSWKNNGAVLVRDEGLPLDSLVEGDTLIGSDGFSPGLPMVWHTFALSSDVFASETYTAESLSVLPSTSLHRVSSPDGGLLYERSGPVLGEITIEDFYPGRGLASMVILSDPGSTEDWELIISDNEGNEFYSLSPSHRAPEEIQDKIVLSFINDNRGFFLSSSVDSGMAGPFAFQEKLNIKIAAGSDDSLSNISTIRFFQD